MSVLRLHSWQFRLPALGLALMLTAAPGAADAVRDVDVKAAMLYNFARFAEWPALSGATSIAICIVGDDRIAAAFTALTRKQNINGHPLDVSMPRDAGTWGTCHLLFIADAEVRKSSGPLIGIRKQPVLTVSDGNGFAAAGGIIELYVDKGRMRFAINLDAVEQSGLNLSSRLLGLARIVRGVPAQ